MREIVRQAQAEALRAMIEALPAEKVKRLLDDIRRSGTFGDMEPE